MQMIGIEEIFACFHEVITPPNLLIASPLAMQVENLAKVLTMNFHNQLCV